MTRTCRGLLSVLVVVACAGDNEPDAGDRAGVCDEPAVRDVVERFGHALQEVSLLAPDARAQMRAHYEPLVTPSLLAQWLADPAAAPGRETSSPWPERIEIDSTATSAAGACVVHGFVAYATSAERAGAAALRAPVTLHVARNGVWRIAAYHEAEFAADGAQNGNAADGQHSIGEGGTDAEAAAAVVRRYYDAIRARAYADAYALWSDDGAASGQSREAFAAGFAETASVAAEVGPPSRPEAAAGSVYVEVPVVVRARTVDGRAQQFAGTYTLRRSTVDGAPAAQRAWRIHAAALRSVPSDSVSAASP